MRAGAVVASILIISGALILAIRGAIRSLVRAIWETMSDPKLYGD